MTGTPADGVSQQPPLVSKTGSLRELTIIEENAIYYSAGYVVKKLLQRYKSENRENADVMVKALLNLLGDNHSNIESFSSYLAVKLWTETTDRGGLKHVSEDTFRCFKALELITYGLLQKRATKAEVISQVVTDDNVLFYWDFVMHDFANEVSTALLHDVVSLWFTIRGFAVTSNLFEQYKKTTSKNIKGNKGLRKELQYTAFIINTADIHIIISQTSLCCSDALVGDDTGKTGLDLFSFGLCYYFLLWQVIFAPSVLACFVKTE